MPMGNERTPSYHLCTPGRKSSTSPRGRGGQAALLLFSLGSLAAKRGGSGFTCCWRCRLLLPRMAAAARGEREIWKKKQLYGLQQRQAAREAGAAGGRACGQTNDRVMASMLDATLSFVDFCQILH